MSLSEIYHMLGDEIILMRLTYLDSLNEVDRRHYIALWAIELGWGGITKVSKETSMSMSTIRKGISEIKSGKPLKDGCRLRKKGGGRKKIIDKNPEILKTLKDIVEESTAGDPMNHLKWTHKSTYTISDILKSEGHIMSPRSIGRVLKENNYTLKASSKSYEGESTENRDAQFQHINKKAEEFKSKGEPHISVDTKKKELVGNFKNPGRIWSKKGKFIETNVYDFPSLSTGKAVPYGTYDLANNKGFVNVGISSDTAEFAVESIRKWWSIDGKNDYPDAKELLICADCGGSNGSRNRGWKYYLQQLANELNIKITVCHYPPSTSKWNKIEHRLFSFISMNWKGKPLVSYQVIIGLINATKTKEGLLVKAQLDERLYKKGKKFTDEQIANLKIEPDSLHPQWNYTISPQNA